MKELVLLCAVIDALRRRAVQVNDRENPVSRQPQLNYGDSV